MGTRVSRKPALDVADPRRAASAIDGWFPRAARDLPWRTSPRDPYRSLVSEFMLQQTQVSRVVERFDRFCARFPSLRALAEAPEDEVLAEWSGLGYYRRARLLHACAKAAWERHGGELPADVRGLRALPGVGDYTAGAIASMVFALPEPAVDGNVIRVMLRLHNDRRPQAAAATRAWATDRAREMALAAREPGVVSEGLMELGATVCTPRAPRCDACPLAGLCAARAAGTAGEIPAPKARAAVRVLHCAAVVDADARGRLLVERRPDTGMWAGLWQAPTLEGDSEPTAAAVRAFAGARAVEPVETFEHKTTHRLVRFRVWRSIGARATRSRPRRTRAEIAALALSNPQRRILLTDPIGFEEPET